MTTTPDSRIRADWTLPAETAAPPPTVAPDTSTTATPDTSTTAGKVAVMQHVAAGGQMQMTTRGRGDSFDDDGWSRPWCPPGNYNFNWERYDYRIAPPPAPRTALQAARERAAMVPPTGGDADNSVRDLLKQIDSCVTMTVHGDGHLKQVHMGLGAMQPGRYRLLRDDA